MKNKFRIILFTILFIALLGCDRITKNIAKENLSGKGTISYFHDTFRLVYIENTGAFLGFGSSVNNSMGFWIFSIIPLIFLVLMIIYAMKKKDEMTLIAFISMAMIISGGLGNIIDRIIYDRHVTDFLNIGIGNLRTGIFNLADVYITTGVIVYLVFQKSDSKRKIAKEYIHE